MEQLVEEQLAAGDWWKPSAIPASPVPGGLPSRCMHGSWKQIPRDDSSLCRGLEKHGRVSAGNPLSWA